MSSTEYAYSLEVNREMTASEAHELYILGIISDKKNFQCCDRNCRARITCSNMDKPQWEMKVREHFKVIDDHSNNCSEKMKVNSVNTSDTMGKVKAAATIGEEINFHLNRPNQQEVAIDKIAKQTTSVDKEKKRKMGGEVGDTNRKAHRKTNAWLLSSIVNKFLSISDKSIIDKIKINFSFGNKSYNYSMSKLFSEIPKYKLDEEENWKIKVYWGKATIKKRKAGGYIIDFSDSFHESGKKVVCLIDNNIVKKAYNKNRQVNYIERFVNKEIKCYILGKVKCWENTIFINVDSIDHIACAD